MYNYKIHAIIIYGTQTENFALLERAPIPNSRCANLCKGLRITGMINQNFESLLLFLSPLKYSIQHCFWSLKLNWDKVINVVRDNYSSSILNERPVSIPCLRSISFEELMQ